MSLLAQQLRFRAEHLLRGGGEARRRAQQLLAEERRPMADAALDAALLRSVQAAAERLPAHAALKPPRSGLAAWLAETVPILDRETLVAGRASHYPAGGRRRLLWPSGKTSGTSGAPLEVFRSYDSVLWEQAFLYQHWAWAGHAPDVRQVVLRGSLVVPADRQAPPYWVHDPANRSLHVSTRHLSEANAPAIAAAIAAFGASQLRAYPSSAQELARLTTKLGLPIRFASIQTSSELLHPLQREQMEQAFGARVFDLYGMAERVALGMECEHGRMHINPHYAHVEIVDATGQPTRGEGRLVGTTLHNQVMPLLRYRLSDAAQWLDEACPCGRAYPAVRLLGGKLEDRVYDLDGRPVSPSVITFAFKGVEGVARSQVAQVRQDLWELRIVPGPGWGEPVEQRLRRNFEQLVSPRLHLEVRCLDRLEGTRAGKFRWVQQEWQQCNEPRHSGGRSDADR